MYVYSAMSGFTQGHREQAYIHTYVRTWLPCIHICMHLDVTQSLGMYVYAYFRSRCTYLHTCVPMCLSQVPCSCLVPANVHCTQQQRERSKLVANLTSHDTLGNIQYVSGLVLFSSSSPSPPLSPSPPRSSPPLSSAE